MGGNQACRHAFAKAVVCFVLAVPAAAAAQTYTVASGSPQPLAVTSKAGDIIHVEATLFSGDPNENGEGEPLIVNLPGGAFTVAAYASPRSTNFVAQQDNQVVSAFIQGFDGDESAVVNFSIQPKPRFTKEQKDAYASAGDRAAIYAAALSAAVPFVDPIRGKILSIGEALEAALSVYYNKLARDPPDPNFTVIAQPDPPSLPLQQAEGPITQGAADAFNALQANQEQQIGLLRALLTSINRADGALQAGNAFWEDQQMQAAAGYALQLATFLDGEAALRAALLAALQASGFPSVALSPNDVFFFELTVAFFGLPPPEPATLAALGVTGDDFALAVDLMIVQDVNAVSAASPVPGVLADPALAADEAAMAAALRAFAASVGVPLQPGQMVQAQGFVATAAGKATFSIEAHFDGSGALRGKLQLDDHGTGFAIRQGDVLRVVISGGGTRFTASGSYPAAGGATGSFTVSADAAAQTVQIGATDPSASDSISGVLQGENATIRQ